MKKRKKEMGRKKAWPYLKGSRKKEENQRKKKEEDGQTKRSVCRSFRGVKEGNEKKGDAGAVATLAVQHILRPKKGKKAEKKKRRRSVTP